ATGLLSEVAAFGVAHPVLGQAIVVIAMGKADGTVDVAVIKRSCQKSLPAWMQPAVIDLRDTALPRNPNGKIDRKKLATEFVNPFVADALAAS
ncbi:MAG: acyl-CoA ligase (AMP-forming), exosortase A system-associated, partial [Burkholderiaceae bacterium]